MRPGNLVFPTSLRRSFSRAAKKSFPAETFALCIGRKTGNTAYVDYLYYPEIHLDDDGKGFSVAPEVFALAADLARKDGLKITGTIHSHCHPAESNVDDASPSETDWDHLQEEEGYLGVCAVVEYPGGRKRTRYRFWPRVTPPLVSCS